MGAVGVVGHTPSVSGGNLSSTNDSRSVSATIIEAIVHLRIKYNKGTGDTLLFIYFRLVKLLLLTEVEEGDGVDVLLTHGYLARAEGRGGTTGVLAVARGATSSGPRTLGERGGPTSGDGLTPAHGIRDAFRARQRYSGRG